MSLNLYNQDGDLGQLCTNAGWGELLDLTLVPANYRAFVEFLETGMSEKVPDLIADIETIIESYPLDKSVRGILDNLLERLPKDSEIAIAAE